MRDPYQVLGVSPAASNEEVKAAYRELVKKLHPDHYVGNPLVDLATERLKEVNMAYDQIMQQRARRQPGDGSGYQGQGPGADGGYRQTGGSGSQGGNRYDTGRAGYSQFADVRRLIDTGRIPEAQEILDGVPPGGRDAEWYYLKGRVYLARNWLEEAYQHVMQANRMEPRNFEYAQAFSQLHAQRQLEYQQNRYSGARACCDGCDGLCTALICADCCCSCLGR